MKTINLSARILSTAIWTKLFEHSAAARITHGDAFFSKLGQLEALRSQAQYNTGSISTSSQWALFSLAAYLAPKVVAEVGTFIGKSAVAIASGMDFAASHGEIHTCDMSNSISLPTVTSTRVVQYPGTGSEEMFRDMEADGYSARVELIHLDGRLQKEDVSLISRLGVEHMVVAIDDFEGIEKGVANVFTLRQSDVFNKHLLIYPPSAEVARFIGLFDHCSTALLIPAQALRFTAQ